jgi:hypothetical protein
MAIENTQSTFLHLRRLSTKNHLSKEKFTLLLMNPIKLLKITEHYSLCFTYLLPHMFNGRAWKRIQ